MFGAGTAVFSLTGCLGAGRDPAAGPLGPEAPLSGADIILLVGRDLEEGSGL